MTVRTRSGLLFLSLSGRMCILHLRATGLATLETRFNDRTRYLGKQKRLPTPQQHLQSRVLSASSYRPVQDILTHANMHIPRNHAPLHSLGLTVSISPCSDRICDRTGERTYPNPNPVRLVSNLTITLSNVYRHYHNV